MRLACSLSAGWIPAGAGETTVRLIRCSPTRVDPRGGGGDMRGQWTNSPASGGSPRGRGRHWCLVARAPGLGWIPAGAGETHRVIWAMVHDRVDPRGGGGDFVENLNYSAEAGGSPRGRGRLALDSVPCSHSGWIPAGAGETAARPRSCGATGVDPRGGGGDATGAIWATCAAGGSPRGRGRPRRRRSPAARAGWIPAGAGET